MPGRIQIITTGLLVFLFAAAAAAKDDVLPWAEDLYSRGEYLVVIDSLETVLADTTDFSVRERIELRRILGSCYVAVLNIESAKKQFKRMLTLDPGIGLDPLSTSPKIVSIFEEARTEFESERQQFPPDTVSQPGAHYQHREGLWISPALKSLILPGLGQLENGDQVRGIAFMSLDVLSLAGLAVSHMWYEDARQEYAQNTDPDRMGSLYDEYNRWYMMRNGFIAACAGLCVLSSVDAIVGAYEKEIEENERTLGFAPIRGGVYAYIKF